MLIDYQAQSDATKAAHLLTPTGRQIKQYHYLFFIATDFPSRGRGLASKLVSRWQEQASKDGLPIWLEATTEHSRDVYVRLGFEVVREMRVGKGTHGASGGMEEGGEGVGIWAMIWWPAGSKGEGVEGG